LLLFYYQVHKQAKLHHDAKFLVACTLLIIYFYMRHSHVMITRDITYI
jgi:hypothetical protein